MNRLIETRPETPSTWDEWPGDAINVRLSVASVAGGAAALGRLADELLEASAAKFSAGEDDIAHFLRDELVPRIQRKEQSLRDEQVQLHKKLAEELENHAAQEAGDGAD